MATFEHSEIIIFFRFIRDMLPQIRHKHGEFLKLLADIFATLPRINSDSLPSLSELCNEIRIVVLFTFTYFISNTTASLIVLRSTIRLYPQFFLSRIYTRFVDFLLYLLRVSSSNPGSKLSVAQSSNDAISLFSDLLQQIQAIGNHNEIITHEMYMKFFDVLRAFPVDAAHSISRLLCWWRFLCLLPQSMIFDGFRRFVCSFLANLLGRYISINAYLGDPKVHKYQLSSTSVYNGDTTAQDLAAYAFSCIFNYPDIEPKEFINRTKLPKLSINSIVLAEHYYSLLVAVFHWLRYLIATDKSICDQNIGDIWIKCLRCIAKAITDCKSDDEGFNRTFIQQSTDLSLRLVSPQTSKVIEPPSESILEPSDVDNLRNPRPHDCVIILHDIADSLDYERVTPELKSTLYYDICAACLNLISIWHRTCCSSDSPIDVNQEDIRKDISLLAVESLEKDIRLALRVNSTVSYVDDHLKLLRQLLSTLVPECSDFVVKHLDILRANCCIPPSCVNVNLNTSKVNEAGLQVWISLTDRLSHLSASHKRVVDLPRTGSENESQNLSSNLSTMYAFCLAPIFLAGNCLDYPSAKLEQKVLMSLFHLFRVLHEEACLLTTVPINSWIDKLSNLIIALLRGETSEVKKKINLRIVCSFLAFMVKSAESVEENSISSFSPSKCRTSGNGPMGQMTGPLNAICLCLFSMPLEHCELSASNSMVTSSPRKQSTRSRTPLTSRTSLCSSLPSTELYEIVFLGSGKQEQNLETAHSVTQNLIYSLLIILKLRFLASLPTHNLFQRHVHSVETLLLLIERSSPGLLALTKRLESFVFDIDDEVPVVIVHAFKAFVTLAWNQLLKSFCKPCVNENPDIQNQHELKPLELPRHAVRQLVTFFEAAVSLASSPIATPDYRAGVATEAKSLTSSSHHKIFILTIVSLWDTLVVSTPAETPDLRERIRVTTGKFSRCLVKLTSPKVSLRHRATLPRWISPNLLVELEDEDKSENDPPPPTQQFRRSSQRISKVAGCEKAEVKKHQKRSRSEPSVNKNKSQLSQSLTSPEMLHRPSASSRPTITPRRRLSLASVASSDQRSTLTTTAASPEPSDVVSSSNASETVQQALRSPSPGSHVDNDDNARPTSSSSSLPLSQSLAIPTHGKKRASSGVGSLTLPNLADFEDSAQFVFIPPSSTSAKRMRLTEHQKERRREQRRAYIPPMYNNLDASGSSVPFPSDSQSSMDSSQSFMQPMRSKDSTSAISSSSLSSEVDRRPLIPPPNKTALTATSILSEGDTAILPVPHEEPQMDAPTLLTAGSDPVSSQTDQSCANVSIAEPAFEEEAPMFVEHVKQPKDVFQVHGKVGEGGEKLAGLKLSVFPDNELPQTKTVEGISSPTADRVPVSPVPSPMLSAFPMLSRVSPTVIRSPTLGGVRAQKILEMGLARAAERSKQRSSIQIISPLASHIAKKCDSPVLRPGILRDNTTPRPKTRVSFVEQPTVFLLGPSSEPHSSDSPFAEANESNPLTSQASADQPSGDTSEHASDCYSPPSLSSSNRRRKSTVPKRYSPSSRMLKELSRSPVGAGSYQHRLSHKNSPSSKALSIVLNRSKEDTTGVSSPSNSSVSNRLRKLPSESRMEVPETQVDAIVPSTPVEELDKKEKDKCAEAIPATQISLPVQVVEETQEIVEGCGKGDTDGDEEMVESTQEPDDSDLVIVSITEPEQSKVAFKPVEVTPAVGAVEAETTNTDNILKLARQTLATFKDQLASIPTEQQKELLFDTLALFKNIMP